MTNTYKPKNNCKINIRDKNDRTHKPCDDHNHKPCDNDHHDNDCGCSCNGPFNTIMGTSGDDHTPVDGHYYASGIVGTAGNDRIYGLAGNDVLVGKGGCNILDGGKGFDYVSYFYATKGVHVDLNKTGFQDTGVSHDKLVSIEGVFGSSHDDVLIASNHISPNAWKGTTEGNINYYLQGFDGNDTLIGGAGNGLFRGGTGDDIIKGGAGNDIIYGGTQNDNIDGGGGFNIMAYDTSPHGVNVDLSVILEPGADGTDTIKNIQGLSGSNLADTLKGDNYDNLLIGLQEDDTLTGGAGKDTFVFNLDATLPAGGDGHDTITDFSKTQDILKFTTSGDVITSISQINTLISSFVDDGSGFVKVNFTNGASIDFQGVAFTGQTSIADLVSDPAHIQHGDLYYTQIASTSGIPF